MDFELKSHATRVSFHYEYASAVMMGLIFLGVEQLDAIKHIQSKDYKNHFCEKIRQSWAT